MPNLRKRKSDVIEENQDTFQGFAEKMEAKPKQWIVLLKDDCVKAYHEHKPAFCTLKHPRTGQSSQFLFSESSVYEVLKFDETYRSWFIGSTVQQDGGMYVTSPVDPLFLVLPYLLQSNESGKFMMLDQIVEDESYPECHRLCSCPTLREHLHQIADCRGDDDLQAYRYSSDKTLKWLKLKVEALADKLEEKKVHVTSGSFSSSFVRSNTAQSAIRDDFLRYSMGVIADYLPLSMEKELQDFMGLKPVEIVHEKPPIQEPNAKKAKKTGDITPSEDYHSDQKQTAGPQKRLSKAQTALKKVDKSGMKSMSSFFAAKPKK